MTTKNPWLGLVPYEEPKKDGDNRLFCGRDEEIIDVVRLIDNNLFITLYGCSGIGKTSLLRAGVIPILRRKNYFPLYVRLSQVSEETSYAKAIVHKLQNCGLTEERNAELKHSDDNDRLYLWEYFATTRFLEDGVEVYPVIILDQFEEVFREGDKAKAKHLLQQIYLLLNDELEMPDKEGWSTDTNYRFVASIREDFLFVLEDSIDECSLDLYKNNRYRLRPMKPEQARKVILVPGKDCIEETEKDAIANRIISLAKRPQSDDIDTLLLSLVCSGTYEKRLGLKITASDLAVWKNNPMEEYYQDAIKGLTAKQIRYIQQNLIREDGSRRRVDAEEVKAALGETTYRQLSRGKNRLLATGDKDKVELLHDQLGMAVYEERKAFEERERKKKLIRRATLTSLVVLAIAWFFFFQNHKLKQQHAALEENQRKMEETQRKMEETQRKTMENQSRFIAEKANKLVDDGDTYTALRLLLEVLPLDVSQPVDKPLTPEAEAAFIKAFYHNSTVLKGHTFRVNAATFSPDGTRIVSASFDSTVRVWDVESRLEITFEKPLKHNSRVYSAAFSPDGTRIVSASQDGTVKLWDTKNGSEIVFEEPLMHNSPVYSAAFSPDGTRIVSGSKDGTVKIWDVKSGLEVKLEKPIKLKSTVNSVAFSPDGTRIVSGSKDGTVKIWDAKSGSEVTFEKPLKHASEVYSAAFSPNGTRIVSGSKDGTVKLWDAKNGSELVFEEPLRHKSTIVRSVAFSPDGTRIVSASEDGTVKIWDIKSGSEVKLEKPIKLKSAVYSAAFSPDGTRIVTASKDGTVRIWNIESESEATILKGHTSHVNFATFNPDGTRIASASDDSTVRIWDIKSGLILITLQHSSPVHSATFSPDGKNIVSTSDDTIRVWDVESGSLKRLLIGHTSMVNFATFSPDGKKIVSASEDSTAYIWDVKSGTILQPSRHESNVFYAAFSPDGKSVILTNGLVKIWDLEKDPQNSRKMPFEPIAKSALFSPDGKKIVVTSQTNTIKIGSIFENGELSLEGHTSPVCSAAFSPDGKSVVSASEDMTVRIWNVKTGLELVKFEGHTSKVKSAAFSPDGTRIVSASDDNTIRIWSFNPSLQELSDQTRRRFENFPLTDAERKTYYLE